MVSKLTLKNLNGWIKHYAAHQPEKTFLIDTFTKKKITYLELLLHCQQLSNWYKQELKISPQGKVAFLMENGLWSTLIFLSVIFSNRIVLPINGIAGKEQILYVLQHSKVKTLIISPTYKKKMASALKTLAGKINLVVCDEHQGSKAISRLEKQVDKLKINYKELPFSYNNIAILIYTSGTTGNPKGVLLSHKNIIAGGKYIIKAHSLLANDRVICVLPLYHINGEIVTVITPLISGGSLVMLPKFSVKNFWQDALTNQCTWINLVPTIISYLLARSGKDKNIDKKKIRKIIRFARSASAPLSVSIHKNFEKKFGIPIVETMGLTETAAPILSNQLGAIRHGSPGKPVGNKAKLVDPITLKEIKKPNYKGEIWIKGDNVMIGYYRNPVETKKTLTSGKWLKTGDLAIKDQNGFYFIKGRKKEIIIKGGENISPREIDDVLYSHPAILEAATVGIKDVHYGNEICACVVLKKEFKNYSMLKLQEYCKKKLGKFKTPKKIQVLEKLPKGASGKIQRLKIKWRNEWNS